MSHPLVSVIIPCYNQGEFLQDSVSSILAQTLDDLEIIVVNDGSTQEKTLVALQALSAPKTRVLHQENKGVSAARNAGIAAASGKYILVFDADDKIEPPFLQRAIEVLDANPGIGLVSCRGNFFGNKKGTWDLNDPTPENMLFKHCLPTCTVFRKDDWAQCGGFDENLHFAEDLDFWLSIIELGHTAYKIPERYFWYRVHEGSAVQRLMQSSKVEIYEKHREYMLYIFRKHAALYFSHPEAMVRRLFPFVVKKPKFFKFKHLKYKIIRAVCGLLRRCGIAESAYQTASIKLGNIEVYLKHSKTITIMDKD